jgi:hypothetical protein
MEEEKIPVKDVIDHTKEITGINLSAAYVSALERLLMYFIMKLDNPAECKPMFEKFERYVSVEGLNFEENFNEEEIHMYTIFSLQQLFKAKAYEQGHNVKINATIDKSDVESLLKATMEGNFDDVRRINEKMQKSFIDQNPELLNQSS